MARTTERVSAVVGRRLVDEGILTQDQVNHCMGVVFEISASDVPRLKVDLLIEPAVFLKLLKEQADGEN